MSRGGVSQQTGRPGAGRPAARRTRRRASRRILRRIRRQAASGVLGRIRLGTAAKSSRLRRWVLAAVLLGVALLPYPVQGASGSPPGAVCRTGCRTGSVPSMIRWTTPLAGSWDVVPGLTGTVPATGLAYAAVGNGVAAVGVGMTVSGYSSATGTLRWRETLTGFPAGAAIVSVRAWPGEVTAGVTYRPSRSAAVQRTEVVISDAGVQGGRYPAAPFGGAVAGSASSTVVVGPNAVTSYDNATGHLRWRQATGSVAQAWRLDSGALYLAESSGGFVGSDPVTALRRIDLATGNQLVVRPLEGLSFDGRLSVVSDGTVLFSSAAGVTAYNGTTGVRLWSLAGAVPEGTDSRPERIYLTRGANLIGVDPQTGRVKSTASGSALNGSAGVYVVRGGVALGMDQGASGDAWGFNLAAQRVTLAAPGLPWPHYFVDLAGVGGSADPGSHSVIIAACKQLAPAPLTRPSPSTPASGPATAPANTAPSGTASGSPGSPTTTPASTSPAGTTPASTTPASTSPAGTTPAGTAPVSPTPAGPAATSGQACLHPELVALSL